MAFPTGARGGAGRRPGGAVRVALRTWNTGPAEAWDAHGNVVVETDLTDEDRWVLLPDAHEARHELETTNGDPADHARLTRLLDAMSPAAHRAYLLGWRDGDPTESGWTVEELTGRARMDDDARRVCDFLSCLVSDADDLEMAWILDRGMPAAVLVALRVTGIDAPEGSEARAVIEQAVTRWWRERR